MSELIEREKIDRRWNESKGTKSEFINDFNRIFPGTGEQFLGGVQMFGESDFKL